MAAREYSKRLGAISNGQLQAALDRFELGRLIAAEPVQGGLFGQNLFITSTGGEYVLRGAPLTAWQFPTEQFFTRQLHDRTRVPAPWPFLIEQSTDIFGWSFAIMPRLSGINAIVPAVRRTLGAKDRRAIARALGRALAEMHELTWPTVGRYVPESGTVEAFVMEQEIRFPMEGRKRPAAGTPPPTDAERVVAVIRALVGAARRMNPHTTDEDAAWTESIIESARDALEVPIEPRFVMQDYQEGNVVVERDGADEWRVSGVFDLGGAYFGDCEADLHRMLCVYLDEDAELAREFVRTYLKLRPPRAGFDERFPAYMLLDRLIIWEYVQRTQPKVASRMGSLRAWAGRYTAALPSLR